MANDGLCVVCRDGPRDYDDYTCSDVCFGVWQSIFGRINVLPLRGTGLPQLLTQHVFLCLDMERRLSDVEREMETDGK